MDPTREANIDGDIKPVGDVPGATFRNLGHPGPGMRNHENSTRGPYERG
jgi:hypothetical protein